MRTRNTIVQELCKKVSENVILMGEKEEREIICLPDAYRDERVFHHWLIVKFPGDGYHFHGKFKENALSSVRRTVGLEVSVFCLDDGNVLSERGQIEEMKDGPCIGLDFSSIQGKDAVVFYFGIKISKTIFVFFPECVSLITEFDGMIQRKGIWYSDFTDESKPRLYPLVDKGANDALVKISKALFMFFSGQKKWKRNFKNGNLTDEQTTALYIVDRIFSDALKDVRNKKA